MAGVQIGVWLVSFHEYKIEKSDISFAMLISHSTLYRWFFAFSMKWICTAGICWKKINNNKI